MSTSTRHGCGRRAASLLAALAWWACAHDADGQLVYDGSIGHAGALAGPNYQINADRGRILGPNLYHSFSSFTLAAHESATFSGPASVDNVLARVTGGTPSNIDGTIRCTIPGANVYLINPAGVVFGPNASIDVTGSFAVTTADFMRLADGGTFGATAPTGSVLTSAAPAAFGFLGPVASGVTVNGSQLAAPPGKSLAIVGGSVQIRAGAQLAAPGGGVTIVSTKGAGEATFDAARPGAAVDLPDGGRGDVAIVGGSAIDVSGTSPGAIVLRADTLRLDASRLTADSTGAATTLAAGGGGIDVGLTGAGQILRGAAISATTVGAAYGAAISLSASDLLLDVAGAGAFTGIRDRTLGGGRGGDVTIHAAGSITLDNGAQVLAQTSGAGAGGNVTLDAGSQVLLQNAAVDASLFSGIVSDTRPGSIGAGGDVTVTAPDVRVRNLAIISASTNGAGNGGTIVVNARDRVLLDGLRLDAFTGIGANTQAAEQAGRGGNVNVVTSDLRILRGAGVAAKTFGPAGGGNIDITAHDILRVDGRRTPSGTGVNAESINPRANGGIVHIRAGRLEMDHGQVTAAAQGDGGTIDMTIARSVRLIGRSEVTAEAQGTGGNITIDPVTVTLDRSRITANAVNGNGGNILIRTSAFVPSSDPLTRVTASSKFGLAGTVAIVAPNTDIAGSLVPLNAAVSAVGARLQPFCGTALGGTFSSFVVVGRGGIPADPAGWQVDLVPMLDAPRSARPKGDMP